VALVLPRHPAAAAAAAGSSSNGKQAELDVFCRTFSETTNVVFAELSKDLIDAYIHTGR
jgi:predicted house-cleaning NTP pyrophosphatase (Maf/HAM1 superfamily)